MDELEEQSEDDTGKVLKYHKQDVLKINVYKNTHLIFQLHKINKNFFK